jgi:hypothetical protein
MYTQVWSAYPSRRDDLEDLGVDKGKVVPVLS